MTPSPGKSRSWRYWRQPPEQRPTSAQLNTVLPKLILIILILYIYCLDYIDCTDHIDHNDGIDDEGKH